MSTPEFNTVGSCTPFDIISNTDAIHHEVQYDKLFNTTYLCYKYFLSLPEQTNTATHPANLIDINNVLEPSEVTGIMRPKYDTVYVRKEDWKECLSEIEEACTVSWIISKSNKLSGAFSSVRQRKLFSELRKCHENGAYVSVAMDRPIQKKTKKCNCKAQLKVECQTRYPDVFVFSFREVTKVMFLMIELPTSVRCL
ncbi:hypothetical protein BDB01DRAFT_899320 [Pilobolus umbonatus]|nr:hypothetical protein BDB01DRAFT_899320 [Pilobolus umbonatus]